MSWVRILAPLTGADADTATLAAAAALAAPFGAEVEAAFAPADAADLTPWMGEGFMGGVQVTAFESLRQAAAEGEKSARRQFDALSYAKKGFRVLESPVWSSLDMEARLADVVVFGADPARGRGPLVESFQRILMEEQRPVYLNRGLPDPTALAAVAWDGGKEATRAARIAVPWLQKCGEVVIFTAPAATPRSFEADRLVEFFAARGVKAHVEILKQTGDAGPMLIQAVKSAGAKLLVAGAFGHPRFQQFIFGGTTRTLMHEENAPSLFLSH